MNSAATVLVQTVADGTWVGVVTFENYGSIEHHLTQVTSDRSSLYDIFTLAAGGGTCIGCGLTTGLDVSRGTSLLNI